MRGIGLGFIFYGIGMVLTQALNGAGDTKSPTWINFLCFWIFQTPLAYFLQSTSLGVRGVIYAIPISHALLAVVAWIIFQRGKWKTMQI
jgi:Na+-driven multidrug efflux pump